MDSLGLCKREAIGRCISWRLQEACGGNNRKPLEHFSLSVSLLPWTTFSTSTRRSRFPIAISKRISVKLKYINICLFPNSAELAHTRLESDVAHRLLPLTAIRWLFLSGQTRREIWDKRNDWFPTVMIMGLCGGRGCLHDGCTFVISIIARVTRNPLIERAETLD